MDTRERLRHDIEDILANWSGDLPEVQFKKLDIGDYLLDNNDNKLLIERKSMGDFCGTLPELVKRRDSEWPTVGFDVGLITEGTYTVKNGYIWLWKGNVQFKALRYTMFRNFVAGLQKRGYYYHHTMNLSETIETLISLYYYIDKTKVEKSKKASEWFAALPGVGDIKLDSIRDRYASPSDAILNVNDWLPKRAIEMLAKW